VQAGVPEEEALEPAPDPPALADDPVLADPVLADPVLADPVLADDGAPVDDVLTLEPPEPEPEPEPPEAAPVVDDAAHPVASTPAAMSGMTSSAFFIGSANAH
jgi:hypothetical protein